MNIAPVFDAVTTTELTATTTAGSGFAGFTRSINPQGFGAVGDGTSHPAGTYLGISTLAALQGYKGGLYAFSDSLTNEMDYLGVQAALSAGGVVSGVPGSHYVVNHMLTVLVGDAFADFTFCTVDFTGIAAAQTSTENLVLNPMFASAADWTQTSGTQTPAVLTGGAATFTDPGSSGVSFGQFGQQITIPAGKWRLGGTVNVAAGASQGLYGLPYCNLGFFGSGVGTGDAGSQLDTVQVKWSNQGTGYNTWTDFELATPVTAWLCFNMGNGNVAITDVYLTPYFYNCAVLLTGDGAGGTNFGGDGAPPVTEISGGIWLGPQFVGGTFTPSTTFGTGIAGFLSKTFSSNENRCNLRRMEIKGFDGAVTWSDHSFLQILDNVNIGYCTVCVATPANAVDAGENQRILNCILYNSSLCINNQAGASLNLFGCSLDYSTQIIITNGGLVSLNGCHVECQPASAGLPLFVLTNAAQVIVRGEYLFCAGFSAGTGDYYATLGDSSCKIDLDTVSLYNMLTASGTWASGPGQITARNLAYQAGNCLLPPMMLRSSVMDCFFGNGGFEPLSLGVSGGQPDGIGILCALYPDSGTITSRCVASTGSATIVTEFAHSGAQSLKLQKIGEGQGFNLELQVFFPMQPGQIAFDEFYYGVDATQAPIDVGTNSLTNVISTKAGSTAVAINDSAGTGPQVGWTVTFGAPVTIGGITLSGTYTVTGPGPPYYIAAATPATSTVTNGGGAVSIDYKQTNWRMFHRNFFVRVDGFDGYGRPQISQSTFAGEADINVPISGPVWNKSGNTTAYRPPSASSTSLNNGSCPPGATHMMIIFDTQNMPAGCPLYFDDLFANAL